MLTFDEALHEYRWNGQKVPHVTGILNGLTDYSMIPADKLERAKQEGRYIHRMVELDCLGDLDVEAIEEWARPAYKAWRDFRDASGFELILSEWKGYHRTQGYAGTLDLLCEVPRLKGWKGVALIDVKRSLYAGPVIGYQTAAYKAIVESDKAMPRVSRRGALRLAKDGKFRLEPFDRPTDAAMFLGCLTYHRARQECGRITD